MSEDLVLDDLDEMIEEAEPEIADMDGPPTFVMTANGFLTPGQGLGFEAIFQQAEGENYDLFDVLVYLASIIRTCDALYNQNVQQSVKMIIEQNPEKDLDSEEVAKNVHANVMAQMYDPEKDADIDEAD